MQDKDISSSLKESQKNIVDEKRNERKAILPLDLEKEPTPEELEQLSIETNQLAEAAYSGDGDTAMQALGRLQSILKYAVRLSEEAAHLLVELGGNSEIPFPIRDLALVCLSRYFLSLICVAPEDMTPIFTMIGPGMPHSVYITVFNYVNIPVIAQALCTSNFMTIITEMLPTLTNDTDIKNVFMILKQYVSRQENNNNEMGRSLIPFFDFGIHSENVTFYQNTLSLLDATLTNCSPPELFAMLIENNIDDIMMERFDTIGHFYKEAVLNIFSELTVMKVYGEVFWNKGLVEKMIAIRDQNDDLLLRKIYAIWINLTSYDDFQYVIAAEETGFVEIASQMMTIGTIKEKVKAARFFKNICNYAINDQVRQIILERGIVLFFVDLLGADIPKVWKLILQSLSKLVDVIHIVSEGTTDFFEDPLFQDVDVDKLYDNLKIIYEHDFPEGEDASELALQFMKAIEDDGEEDQGNDDDDDEAADAELAGIVGEIDFDSD